MTMGGILVSGAFIDLLADFDIGATQVLELPMYEGIPSPISPLLSSKQPDLWFDKRVSDVPFISDRLRQAIVDAGLRVPTMKWLKEAALFDAATE